MGGRLKGLKYLFSRSGISRKIYRENENSRGNLEMKNDILTLKKLYKEKIDTNLHLDALEQKHKRGKS